MKKYFFFFVLAGTAIFSSCDKVDDPYNATATPVVPPSAGMVRKILLEEFTGHKCPNCPAGAVTLHSVQQNYPEQIIGVAIHSSFNYSLPLLPPSIFTQNFQTTVGDNYRTMFSPGSFPSGMVNRRHFATNGQILGYPIWHDSIAAIISKAPDAFLTITNMFSAGQLTTTVKCKFLSQLTSTYNLVLLLTEDSIIAPQTNGTVGNPADPNPVYGNGGDVSNYVHMHLLRDCISDAAGAGVAVTPTYTGDSTVTTTFPVYTLPVAFPVGGSAVQQTIPNPKNCRVVAFIYDTATKEVIQAEEKNIQ